MSAAACPTHFPRAAIWLAGIGLLSLAIGPIHSAPEPELPPAPVPRSAPQTPAQLEQTFRKTVQPFLESYCSKCHGETKPKGDLDLSPFKSVDAVAKDPRRWSIILERLQTGDMPPENAPKHPAKELRLAVIECLQDIRKQEADRTAGDPGPVPARRLSNAEYNNTVRDLTGVDIRPTRDFPIDPANEAGFDNSAESLATSPALVKKYLEAARRVADQLVLAPDGLEFAPHPVITDTDRDKYCVNRIIAFYKRQKTDLADYFLAAWKYKNRAALGRPSATLDDFAMDAGLSLKYLATIWTTLEDVSEKVGPFAAVKALWRELPEGGPESATRRGCEKMRDFVVDLRAKLVPAVKNLTAPKVHEGSQPLVLWKDRQFAANRMRYSGGALTIKNLHLAIDSAAAKAMAIPTDPDEARRYEATFERFCSTFPDAFYVSERARVYLNPEQEKKLAGRLLSAGFHSQMGYFRDDGPLCKLMLDEAQQQELDRLWRELDYVANAPVRQYTGLIWFDRTDSSFMRDTEFNVFRAEDKDCTSDAKVQSLARAYLAKARRAGAGETALDAIQEYFESMRKTFRWLDRAHVEAEPRHVAALLGFAERAYRRPLSLAERDALTRFYRSLREREGLGHEDAIRDSLVSVLLSPHFCFRIDLPGPGSGPTLPLTDYALASRLSYFLWASSPDQLLLDHAKAGDLRRPEVLAEQCRRMLRDPRARGLATEFAGNWLDIRRFEEHNAVDRNRFPAFDNDLRQAMFEEPIRLLMDIASRDGSVLDFLYADYTIVNRTLSRHYGMPMTAGSSNDWVRIDGARSYGRGGLLPMAVFLTKNAPGLRTSPVKRGYWLARRVLGEHIPAPPPNVPELPADESKLGELTLRDALARHRADKNCAGCHEKFDSLGLVFEGYGPIGERRNKDLGGKAIDASAVFPGGSQGEGLTGLIAYIRGHRQQDFIDNLCQKLLAYALGRSLLPSDEQLLQTMREKLQENNYRFSAMVETIVTSPQFLNKRGQAATR